MGYVILHEGQRVEITLAGPRRLAEILSDREYTHVQNGSLVAVTSSGGIMDLSSPLEEGQEVTLRRPSMCGYDELMAYDLAEEIDEVTAEGYMRQAKIDAMRSSDPPARIRMSAEHAAAGTLLDRYTGKRKVIALDGGLVCTVEDGDYLGVNCHMPRAWLIDNPDDWEIV